jgi:hypothetical protein
MGRYAGDHRGYGGYISSSRTFLAILNGELNDMIGKQL